MSLGCKDIGIRKSKFVAKTQFLCKDPNFLTKFYYRTMMFENELSETRWIK